jgi:hypothetical protein
VNYRVDPEVLARIVPLPFRPQIVCGLGIAGICLIRLKHVRPRGLPGFVGLSSENAAHRIAVEWEEHGRVRSGVYIPRRDTSSWVNHLAGGRVFPGVHHRARFEVDERDGLYRVRMDSDDGVTRLLVEGHVAERMPDDSVFTLLEEASAFFEAGSVGYSVTHVPGQYDGLELRSFRWQVEPLAVARVASSYFEDPNLFPHGTAVFDSALLMRGIEHEWWPRHPVVRADCACCR